MDALALLKKDHDTVKKLFERFVDVEQTLVHLNPL